MNAFAHKIESEGEEVELWRSPDMSVLSAGRRTPPVMPPELFGSAWGLLRDLAEGAGAPVEYVAVSYLAVAASLIGGKRRVRPYSTSNWAEPCILWTAVVGDPSSNKSPAIDAATGPLRDIETDLARNYADRLAAWEADAERAGVEKAAWKEAVKNAVKDGVGTPPLPSGAVEPEKPQRRRLSVMDATPESLGTILSGNPEGTLHIRDELAGWLTSFDRYAPGGRQFWLEAYGGRRFIIDRQKNEGRPLIVPYNGVCVLGGIQPDRLSSALLDGDDDGLVARFLWAWPEPVPYHRPRAIADERALDGIYRRLDGLQWGVDAEGRDTHVTLPLDEAAATLFETWMSSNREGLSDAGTLFKGFCGKLPGTVLRLSLIAELAGWAARGGDEPRSISVHTVAAAASFVDDYAKPSALRVFGDAALPPVERHAATLARYIVKNRIEKFNARALRRQSQLPGMRDAEPFNRAVEFLVEAEWLRSVATRAGPNVGRKSSDYIVNPAVHGADDEPLA